MELRQVALESAHGDDQLLGELVQRRRNYRRFFAAWKLPILGLAVIVIVTFLSIFAPAISPYEPNVMQIQDRFQGPSAAHPSGTDEFGRDLFTRVLYGGRISLMVAVVAVSIIATGGGFLGLTSGYLGGHFDTVVGRILDTLYGFPTILLALAIVAIRGPSLTSAMLAIGIHGIPGFARVTRASVMGERNSDYVLAAVCCGAHSGRIMRRHILPNVLGPMLVGITLALGFAILDEAALSFLGLGTQPPTPSWGAMLNDGRGYISESYWYSIGPGLVIFLMVLSINLLGDGIRDALDPRLRK